MINHKAIKEFQDLYLKEYGKKLTDEQASELGTGLLNLFKLIYKPIAIDNKQKLKDPFVSKDLKNLTFGC